LSQLLDGQRDVSDLTTPTGIAGLELVPGDGYLAGAERMLAGLPVPQTRVRRALSAVAAYDLVLIDCPPALGLLTVNALAAASGLIVPVAAQAMELDGLADLQQTIAAVRDGLGHDVAIDAVVACRVRTRTTLARDVIDGLRHVHGDVVLNTVVRDNVRVAEAYAWQEPVTVYNPECAGAHDHYAVAVELETRIWP
jgi:chromosome partitioning protein